MKKIITILLLVLTCCFLRSEDILLYWNKIPNAVKYELTYITENGVGVIRNTSNTNFVIENVNTSGRYTVTIKSIDKNNFYSDSSSPVFIKFIKRTNTSNVNIPKLKYKILTVPTK